MDVDDAVEHKRARDGADATASSSEEEAGQQQTREQQVRVARRAVAVWSLGWM
jgi:hypothetical protein